MEQDYRKYVVYVDDRKFEYNIEEGIEPCTNKEWYNYVHNSIYTQAGVDFLEDSEHIRVYTILPSIGDGLLITEFNTEEALKEGNKTIEDETTSGGIEEHNEEGVKYDDGKPLAGDMIMIFPHALMGVAKCIEWGSHKYPQTDNYIRLKNGYKRYMNGIMRHLLKMMLGQQYDDETKLPHIYHVCWNALAICEHWFKNQSEEDKEKLMEGLLMPITLKEEPGD